MGIISQSHTHGLRTRFGHRVFIKRLKEKELSVSMKYDNVSSSYRKSM